MISGDYSIVENLTQDLRSRNEVSERRGSYCFEFSSGVPRLTCPLLRFTANCSLFYEPH